jgi:valyl-tRNA synthetase
MRTLYGVLTGEGEGTGSSAAQRPGTAKVAMNSSSKFDFGRNFANKLWNATRFALLSLDQSSPPVGFESISIAELRLEDRWILTRLHRTLHRVEDALADYQFNAYAEAMYDFVWREFCDWYLEAIKPTVRDDTRQQHVLRTVLNAIMRLLHPICPFVTETLWPHVRSAGPVGLDGVALGDGEILAGASWPDIACKVDDKPADELFTRIQTLVDAIRTVRGERKVPVKRQIKLLAPKAVIALIESADGVVQQLAGLSTVSESSAMPTDAIPLVFEGHEMALTDLIDATDSAAERQRLEREIASHEKSIAAMKGRLSNDAYVNKAPAAMVQQTRDQLAAAEAALAAATKALNSLMG